MLYTALGNNSFVIDIIAQCGGDKFGFQGVSRAIIGLLFQT